MKSILKALLRRTPYRIVRASAKNRFDAIEEAMLSLSRRGFRPTRIIDGGANIGDFSRKAKAIFLDAAIEMIEPQPACGPTLESLQRQFGYRFHPYALVAPEQMGGGRGALERRP